MSSSSSAFESPASPCSVDVTFADTPADYWFALAKWSKENNQFNGFVRRFIFNVGVMKSNGKELSEKQLVWANKILQESSVNGFNHTPQRNEL
jgi:hypothetical protein